MVAIYIELRDNDKNKGASMYIDRTPKASGNIARFINNMRTRTTNKQPNCIFEGHLGNRVFVCVIKSIATREELLINYKLNQIDADIAIMRVVCNLSLMIPIFYVYHSNE